MVDKRKLSAPVLAAAMVAMVACAEGPDEADGTDADTAGMADETAAADRYRAVVVPEGVTWEEARQRAEAEGGHLVTITSQEENDAVHALIADDPAIWVNVDTGMTAEGEEEQIQVSIGPWIGLQQATGSTEPDGGWTWVTGESLSYANWAQDPLAADALEPNDLGGVEHYGHFFGTGLDNRGSGWNDLANDPPADYAEAGVEFTGEVASPRGYIVEFEQ